MEKLKKEESNIQIQKNDKIILDNKLYFYNMKRSFANEFFISINEKDIDLFENNLKIEIIPLIKSYLEILFSKTSLYCLNTHYSIISPIVILAKKEPLYIMDLLYNKLKEILNLEQSDELNLGEICFRKYTNLSLVKYIKNQKTF